MSEPTTDNMWAQLLQKESATDSPEQVAAQETGPPAAASPEVPRIDAPDDSTPVSPVGEGDVRAYFGDHSQLVCRRRFNIDHLCRLNFDQGLLPAVSMLTVDNYKSKVGIPVSLSLG